MKNMLLCLAVALVAGTSQAALFSWAADWSDNTPDSIALYYVEGEAASSATPTSGVLLESFSAADLTGSTTIEWISDVSSVSAPGGFYLVTTGTNPTNFTDTKFVSYADALTAGAINTGSSSPLNPILTPTNSYNFGSVQPVPEPATTALFLGGLAMLGLRRRRR